jgi:hypothetical protein
MKLRNQHYHNYRKRLNKFPLSSEFAAEELSFNNVSYYHEEYGKSVILGICLALSAQFAQQGDQSVKHETKVRLELAEFRPYGLILFSGFVRLRKQEENLRV